MRKDKAIQSTSLSGKQFKALVENAYDGIVLYDANGRISYVSPPVIRLMGYARSEIVGKKWGGFLHKDDVTHTRGPLSDLLKHPGKNITLIQRIRHKKGHYLWIESRLTNNFHVSEINGVVSNFRDITEKKAAEEKEKRTRNLLETINRNISEGIVMGILGREFIYVNDAFLRMTGFRSFTELASVRPEKIFAVKSVQQETTARLRSIGILQDKEVLFKRKDGTTFWAVMNARVVRHNGGDNYYVGTLRDISREKEAEVQLSEARNLFNNIINTVAAPIFIKDARHRWVMCNDSFCELVGRPKRQILGKSDPDFVNAEEARLFWKSDNETLQSGRTVVNQESLTLKGKQRHLLTVKSRYVSDKGDMFIIGFITDITYLKNAEEEIKHLNENLEGVLESSEESIFSVDRNMNYTAFNQRHRTIMKLLYDADIETGKNKIRYFRNHPDGKWVKQELLKALEGNHFVTDHYQDFRKYKGYIQTTYNPIRGERDDVKGVAVFVQDITDRKRYEQIINSINASLRGVMESTSDGIIAIDKNFRVTQYNNSFAKGFRKFFGSDISKGIDVSRAIPPRIRKMLKGNIALAFGGKRLTAEEMFPQAQILEISFNPIFDHQGEVSGVALFIRNITERKRIEDHNRALNSELVEQNEQLASQEEELKIALKELSERNFELDQLMYKTSHDLRSPLSSIIGLVNLAHLDHDPSTFREYLSKIEGRAKKLDEFIRSMLDYARVNRLESDFEEINLRHLINNCISELEYMETSRSIKTVIDIDPEVAMIRSDRLRLKIIFSNIISNAFKYRNTDTNSFLKIRVKSSKGSILLLFHDNGIGIKDEHHAKIFNMFYRATDRSQGSGLGMYIVKQAVEKLRGKIDLTSDYGNGTKIRIRLPSN